MEEPKSKAGRRTIGFGPRTADVLEEQWKLSSYRSYVQARAGHAQATMTERYIHAAQVAFPGAAERAEERLFASVKGSTIGA